MCVKSEENCKINTKIEMCPNAGLSYDYTPTGRAESEPFIRPQSPAPTILAPSSPAPTAPPSQTEPEIIVPAGAANETENSSFESFRKSFKICIIFGQKFGQKKQLLLKINSLVKNFVKKRNLGQQ